MRVCQTIDRRLLVRYLICSLLWPRLTTGRCLLWIVELHESDSSLEQSGLQDLDVDVLCQVAVAQTLRLLYAVDLP